MPVPANSVLQDDCGTRIPDPGGGAAAASLAGSSGILAAATATTRCPGGGGCNVEKVDAFRSERVDAEPLRDVDLEDAPRPLHGSHSGVTEEDRAEAVLAHEHPGEGRCHDVLILKFGQIVLVVRHGAAPVQCCQMVRVAARLGMKHQHGDRVGEERAPRVGNHPLRGLAVRGHQLHVGARSGLRKGQDEVLAHVVHRDRLPSDPLTLRRALRIVVHHLVALQCATHMFCQLKHLPEAYSAQRCVPQRRNDLPRGGPLARDPGRQLMARTKPERLTLSAKQRDDLEGPVRRHCHSAQQRPALHLASGTVEKCQGPAEQGELNDELIAVLELHPLLLGPQILPMAAVEGEAVEVEAVQPAALPRAARGRVPAVQRPGGQGPSTFVLHLRACGVEHASAEPDCVPTLVHQRYSVGAAAKLIGHYRGSGVQRLPIRLAVGII
mmetsp:Transcript_60548/g.180308  ORF Transcript_60548/g.180308 Transcript_60548/m.180308 type:complete len:439 (-) Transcript_60548:444-1760(-)